MPLDGIVISNIKSELLKLKGARIDKIHQPETDEIVLIIRGYGESYRLLLTATSQNPRIHFTEISKENPKTPPLFCMVLRKHLSNGKITAIHQPDFERIVEIFIEAPNEMGDIYEKRLIIEIMGKHSNIILVGKNNTIIDSIKHISYDKSSVRQVLPGRDYFYPPSQQKLNPLLLSEDEFLKKMEEAGPMKLQEAIYKSYNGISPVMASHLCINAQLDPSLFIAQIEKEGIYRLYNAFSKAMENVLQEKYAPELIYEASGEEVKDFYSFPISVYENNPKKEFGSISSLIENFYIDKDKLYRTKQKTQDLRKLVQNHIDRLVKKKEIQIKTLKEVENREAYRIKGELLTSNIHSVEKGMTSFTAVNFYDENMAELAIELDPNMTPSENAQKYFKKYNKAKRTFAALQEQMVQTDEELYYLDSVMSYLSGKLEERDIKEIRAELSEEGYIKKHKEKGKKSESMKLKPMHFVSRDGFDIYVGKNNKQNDELTLKIASNNDIWLHTKNIPGSHVIIKSMGREITDKAIEDGAMLAAYFSKGQSSSMVPVDYTYKKNVKKPAGAKPGMVIYETNKTAYITPDINIIKELNKDGISL
jgi:predicted ribosome quality control (RQC) complex YloA/Tae2 family protein